MTVRSARRASAILTLGVTASLLWACTLASRSEIGEEARSSAGEPAYQALFRVKYSGPAGSGGVRLILKQPRPERFRVDAADPLGRRLWTLDVESSVTRLVDHRGEVYCEASGLEWSEPALRNLPPVALPRVLMGRLPPQVDRPAVDARSGEITDAQGHRWRWKFDEQGLAAWTMWIEAVPTLWWTREDRGGILSHRDGSQFRWRRVVVEPLAGDLGELEIPETYERVSCESGRDPRLGSHQR